MAAFACVGTLLLGMGAGYGFARRRGRGDAIGRHREPELLLHPNTVRVEPGRGRAGHYLTLVFSHVANNGHPKPTSTAFDVAPEFAARLRDELSFQLEAIADDDPLPSGRAIPLDDDDL